MGTIFFLVRLPFFLIALFLYSDIVLALGLLAAMVWYGVLLPLWLLVGIPGTIFSSAFSNRNKFPDYVKSLEMVFWKAPSEILGIIAGHYGSLFDWLEKGGG